MKMATARRIDEINILWACTGSVATVKLPSALRALQDSGVAHKVKVVTTHRGKTMLLGGATARYDPTNFSLVASGTQIYTDEDEWPADYTVGRDEVLHIELRKWAHVLVIAPLSANTLAKLANGICDNLLTCVARAWDPSKPIVVAPAMNTMMWEHPFTARHLQVLREFGYFHVVAPVVKTLACKDTGNGAMASVLDIVTAVLSVTNKAQLTLTSNAILRTATNGDTSDEILTTATNGDMADAPHEQSSFKESMPLTSKQNIAPESKKRTLEEESPIKDAAHAIANATHLFIGAGAGCSADSGLQVFAQLTQQEDGLTYDQIASSDMLGKDPSRALKFWLETPYLSTEPHDGYAILNKWRVSANSQFVVTSNVDAFFVRSLPSLASSVSQIHGSLSNWQCGGVPSTSFPRWTAKRCCDELFPPPVSLDPLPRCPRCEVGLLRPHVYLFGDGDRFAPSESVCREHALSEWCESVKQSLHNSSTSLVILEIGCGLRVPSVRKRCEELFLQACKIAGGAGPRVQFIRINPEYPLHPIMRGGVPTIPIKAGAFETLQAIDREIVSVEGRNKA